MVRHQCLQGQVHASIQAIDALPIDRTKRDDDQLFEQHGLLKPSWLIYEIYDLHGLGFKCPYTCVCCSKNDFKPLIYTIQLLKTNFKSSNIYTSAILQFTCSSSLSGKFT